MSSLKIVYKNIDEIHPYKYNPRNNTNSINEVKESIEKFGFKVPIIIDRKGVIICGHTRYEASKKLELKQIPCIIANDLSENEIKAFRLVDNKVAEFSRWDYEKLKEEISKINDDFITKLKFIEELDISDNDFVADTEITKEKVKNALICPKCGERIV